MKFGRPSHPTVVAYLALISALGGSAYAASKIGSQDVANNSLRSKDFRDDAVTGRDVRNDKITGRDVREATLDASEFSAVGAGGGGVCDPSSATPTVCAEATIKLPQASRVLVIGTGGFFSEGGESRSLCEVRLDNHSVGAATPGEDGDDSTSAGASDGFAITGLAGPASPGTHSVTLYCNQVVGDARISQPIIAAIAVGAER
jgi:hypothetical protein